MAKVQKQRAKKTSKGEHGSGGKGRPLTQVEKINISNGGLMVGCAKRWREKPNAAQAKAMAAEENEAA
jgi:hypothetical protein